jgi:nucleotide-binding universal stress UspA family protein
MFKRILVPFDGSEPAYDALATAVRIAKGNQGALRILHVVEEAALLAFPDPMGGSAGALAGALRDNGNRVLEEGRAFALREGVQAEGMLFDEPGERLGETIARAAKLWNADLIVLGTHGRRGIARLLLGSGAESIIRLAPANVLVARPSAPD